MPQQETKKSKEKKTRGKKKGKKAGEVTYKDKAKTYKFRVGRTATGGDKLAIELARQQYASIQAEKDKLEREKRTEEKKQKEREDELKAASERERKQAEKFSKNYEPTLLNILDLYRSLDKDPKSFVAEQEKMAEKIATFTDVLTKMGMNPDVAGVRATEAALQDLLEKRQEEGKKKQEIKEAQTKTDYEILITRGWSEDQAKKLADLRAQKKAIPLDEPGNAFKVIAIDQEIKNLLIKAYTKEGWTAREIQSKLNLGIERGNLDFKKPTREDVREATGKRRGLMEEEKVEYPLPSGSIGPPPLMETPPHPPFPGSKPMEEEPPVEEQALIPYAPTEEKFPQAKEWSKAWGSGEYKLPTSPIFPDLPPLPSSEFEQYWEGRKTSEPEFSKEVKAILGLGPPKQSISSRDPEYWSRVGTVGPATAREEKEEYPAPKPISETILTPPPLPVAVPHVPPTSSTLESLLGGGGGGGGAKTKEKETRVVIPPAPQPPIPAYQPVQQYKEPKYKPPGQFEYLEGLQIYDPSKAPTGFTRAPTQTDGALVIYKPKEKIITPQPDEPLKRQRVEPFPVQQLPAAFGGGGGGGPPPMQFEEEGPASSQRIFTSSDY